MLYRKASFDEQNWYKSLHWRATFNVALQCIDLDVVEFLAVVAAAKRRFGDFDVAT